MKNSLLILTSMFVFTCTVCAQLHFVKTVTVTDTTEGGSARPEIVATADRVFVLYLGDITAGENRTFKVKIYKSNLNTIVTSKVLVSRTSEYGSSTDIRVAFDRQYLYTFYETNKPTSPTTATTYLWGAKYALNDSFDRIAYTQVPITNSKPMSELQDGGELVDDPAPLVGSNSVFVVTRLKYSLAIAGKTIYRVREFSKSDLTKLSEFDLDLSTVADGRGRVTSLLFWNNYILMALATTISDQGINENTDDGALSDIVLARMRQDWTIDPQNAVQIISAEPNDRENYVSGFKTDGVYFYVTYKQAVGSPPSGEQIAWIKIFDKDFNLIHREKVRSTVWGPDGGEMRPSLEVLENRIFSGQSAGESLGSGNAQIFLYERVTTSANSNDFLPKEFSLFQNYPNPFNPSTTIRFSLPQRSHVTLKIFDVLGGEVATLVDTEIISGEHSVVFVAAGLPSGVYVYRLETAGKSLVQKMTLLR
jgi:hypothetical protein